MHPFRVNPGLTWLWILPGFVGGMVLGRLFSLRALAQRLLEFRSRLRAENRLAVVFQGARFDLNAPPKVGAPGRHPGWNPGTLALTPTGNNPTPN